MKKERTVRLINNLKTIIKMGIKSDKFQKLIQLSEIETEKLDKEIEDFQEDIKIYGSGIFLWLEDRYPNVVLMYSLVGVDFLSKLKVRPRMKVVVDECYIFIADVKDKNLRLYKEEMEESQKMDFTDTIQPKDLLKKNAYINYINRRISEDIQFLTPQIQAYSEKITPELKLFFKNLKEKLEYHKSMEKEIQQKKNPLIRQLKNVKLIKVLVKELSPSLHKFNEKIKEIQNETLPNVNDIADDFKDMKEEIKKIYDENTSIAYQKLTLIKDIDSFHMKFTKFVARLFHILTNGDRDFRKKSYIQINPHWYDPKTRNKLKEFLDLEIKTKYPELSKYLRSMFNYNKYRKLDAHENPKVRFTNGIAYFTKPGKQEVEMDLNEITKITNTYSYFIDSLRLFQ